MKLPSEANGGLTQSGSEARGLLPLMLDQLRSQNCNRMLNCNCRLLLTITDCVPPAEITEPKALSVNV